MHSGSHMCRTPLSARLEVNSLDVPERGYAGPLDSGDRGGNPSFVGRKSVLMGLAASVGLVFASLAQKSPAAASTVKPIAATQSAYAPRWTPNTVYAVGQQVISPNNDVVAAHFAHKSSGIYETDTVKWTLSSTYARKASLDVRDFGVIGDGIADDTVALQAAITATVTAKAELVARCSMKISAPIVIGLGDHFTFDFTGSIITQATDNTPIFRFTKEDTGYFVLKGVTFQWANHQPATNTHAIAFAFDPDTNIGHGLANFTLENIWIVNGFSFVGTLQATTASTPLWGMTVRKIFGGYDMTGPVIDVVQVCGAPNISIVDFYARRDGSTLPAIRLSTAQGLSIIGFETNLGSNTQLSLTNCRSITLNNIRTESVSLTTADAALFSFLNCAGVVNGIQVQSVTCAVGAGNRGHVAIANSTSVVAINGMSIVGATLTSGGFYALRCDGAASVEFNGYNSDTVLTGKFSPDGSETLVFRSDNYFPRGVRAGAFADTDRPTMTAADQGTQVFDVTLGKMICWNGTTWVDAMGAAVPSPPPQTRL